MDEAAIARVERQRVELEGQIAQLRKSLRHWQTLEIDYEGLKEEFSLLPEDCPIQQALDVAKDFAAELVDDQEIRILFGANRDARRTPVQVINLLSKRVDYVTKNASTIKKQLSDAERKRNALLLVKEPDYRDEAGLPLIEITEELDDCGNVVSSRLETTTSAVPQLKEVLKKAGVDDLVEKDGILTAASSTHQNADLNASIPVDSVELKTDACKKQGPESKLPEYPEDLRNPHDSIIRGSSISAEGSQSAKRPHQGNSSTSQDDESTPDSIEFPTNPDDTEEDAVLRREMLEYAHSEIGPIVAQLELDEGASDISYDENDDELSLDSELDDDIDEEDESEDEYGQTKSPVISDRYRRKMEQLEKDLGFKGMQNLGPEPNLPTDVTNDLNKPPAAEAARKAAIKRAEAAMTASGEKATPEVVKKLQSKKSKNVTFASNLDIAKETELQPPVKMVSDENLGAVSLPPVSGSVVERLPTTMDSGNLASSTPQPKKISRFKAARDTIPQTSLLLPPPHPDPTSSPAIKSDATARSDDIMSAAVIERPGPPTSRKTPPPDLHDFDEALHKQEIAGEYYRSRNKMIQRQGGFVRDGEDDNYGEFTAPLSLLDEETGKIKKISRFKAARLR